MTTPNTIVRSRPVLAGSLQEFPLEAAGMGAIGYQICPVIEAPEQSGEYGNIAAKEILTPGHRKRAPGGGYPRSKFEFGERTYKTVEHGGEGVIDDRRAAQYKTYFEAEKAVTAIERFKNTQAAELRIAALAMNTSTFASQLTPAGVAWSNHGSANPIKNVHTGKLAIRARTGILPNIGYCSWDAFENLKHNDKIIARIQAEGAGKEANVSMISADKVAEILGVKKLLVGGLMQNTSNIGQDATIASVWDTDIFGLGYIDETGNIEFPTAMRCFHWGEDGSNIGGVVESYRDETVRADVVRVRHDTDEQVVMGDLIELITGIA